MNYGNVAFVKFSYILLTAHQRQGVKKVFSDLESPLILKILSYTDFEETNKRVKFRIVLLSYDKILEIRVLPRPIHFVSID